MFRWYQRPAAYFAYLEDVGSQFPSVEECIEAVAVSMWFERGRTHQELIALTQRRCLSYHGPQNLAAQNAELVEKVIAMRNEQEELDSKDAMKVQKRGKAEVRG